jgi:hypothetical protein
MARRRRQLALDWDHEDWVVTRSKFEPKNIWAYQPIVDPPPDPAARAAARTRHAQIRRALDRYLRTMGAR